MSEEIFKEAIPPYQAALDNSGFKFQLYFDQNLKKHDENKKQRKRKIIWFLKIVTESFPKTHKLAKIFNRNSLKLSINRIDSSECPVINKKCNKSDNIYLARVITHEKQVTILE